MDHARSRNARTKMGAGTHWPRFPVFFSIKRFVSQNKQTLEDVFRTITALIKRSMDAQQSQPNFTSDFEGRFAGTDGKILSPLFMDAKPYLSQARISLKWFDSRKKSHMLETNSRNGAGRAWYRSIRRFGGNSVGISGQSVEETENK